MQRRFVIFTLLLISGCFPDWTGSFSGYVSSRVECSRSQETEVGWVTLSLQRKGNELRIFSNSIHCEVTGKIEGARAVVPQTRCFGEVEGWDSVFERGTLRLDGDILDVEIVLSHVSREQTCVEYYEGTLIR